MRPNEQNQTINQVTDNPIDRGEMRMLPLEFKTRCQFPTMLICNKIFILIEHMIIIDNGDKMYWY